MANELITSNTIVRKQAVHYTVSEATNGTLYSAILAGTVKLPANSFVSLVTSGGVKTTKLVGDVEQTYALSEGITVSSASVGDALKAKTAINALTAVATANASDPATTQALANANKVAINAVIASLKA